MNSWTGKVAACHQANFLPWLGFFDKMDRCDIFILLDMVQFSRGSVSNRVKILSNNEAQYLTVPVYHVGSLSMQFREIRINHAAKFIKRTTTTLLQNYKKYPYWRKYGEPVVEIINGKHEFLFGLNVELIRFLADSLGIGWEKVKLQSDFAFRGQKSELIASLVKSVGADTYLSGGRDPGGALLEGKTGTAADYNDPAVYAQYGITLKYQNFIPLIYDQGIPVFVSGLSAIDALVRLGDRTIQMVRARKRRENLQ